MGLFQKKKTDNTGLDVITEIKEPFSFATFFENHVVERYKKIRTFLEEKGVLFFLLSPFQQRNRLIVQLAIIVCGVLLGVVPRSNQLVDQSKARNAASELAALVEKDTQVAVGNLLIRPLASSQYEKQHLMAFLLSATGNTPIPSAPGRYDVALSAARGVTYPEDVTYAYDVLPVGANQRLLLVYADNRKQEDETGIYNLQVKIAEEDLGTSSQIPLEVVLSNTQKTTELFNKDGIQLSGLTEQVLNNSNQPIQEARDKLEVAMKNYTLELERIDNLPFEPKPVVSPSMDELETFVAEHTHYPTLTDKSTTEDVTKLTELTQAELSVPLEYPAALTYKEVRYDAEYVNTLNSNTGATIDEETGEPVAPLMATDEELQLLKELDSLTKSMTEVLSTLNSVNQANQFKFSVLKDYKLMLNRDVDVKSFEVVGTVGDTKVVVESE